MLGNLHESERRPMIIAALILPAAIGFTALAVEGGVWYADRHQLRNMADAAAINAGWARKEGDDEQAAADEIVFDVGFDGDTDEVVVDSPPSTGPYAGDADAIEVIARRTRPLMLSTLFMESPDITIEVRAVVRLPPSDDGFCVLALDPTADSALNITGSADIDLTGCGVHVNSSDAEALKVSGSGDLTTDFAHVTGGYLESGSGDLISAETPETGVATLPDPFADLVVPSTPAGCTQTNYSLSGNPPDPTTLSPGRYCNGLNINANEQVIFSPGVYLIDEGEFMINGQANITGTGVTIILTGSGSDWASGTINGGANVNLSAPTSGPFAGVAFMKDPASGSSGEVKFNGGADMNISGAIYVPTDEVEFIGNVSVGTGCTIIVAGTVKFSGNSSLGNDCSDYDIPNSTGDGNPVLVG